MSPQKEKRQCPLSPDGRKMIKRKPVCTPVDRKKNSDCARNANKVIFAIPFPKMYEDTTIASQWKRKRVTFTGPTIAEYDKDSEPYKFTCLQGAPVKEKKKCNCESITNFDGSKDLFNVYTKKPRYIEPDLFRPFPGNAPKKPKHSENES